MYKKNFYLFGFIVVIFLLSIEVEAKEIVFLYYDETCGFNPDGWGDWKSTKKIENAVVAELEKARVEYLIGNAEEFVTYMRDNPRGIVVCPIIIPETVVDDILTSKVSKIEKWLYSGGLLIYSGDTPFFSIGLKGKPGQKVDPKYSGMEDVFNFSSRYTELGPAVVEPTDLGLKYIPDLQLFSSLRPARITRLEDENCITIEVYGRSNGLADPVFFACPDMRGGFVHIHMEQLAKKSDKYLAQVGLEIGELIVNRFGALFEAVQPKNKVALTWAHLKTQ